ncbi:uncharacterized protein LOC141913230 [Tubulanus polymorphus]|uniref:uncharacterized protein LOC141913230 n=1 Tax=Tubulanus polymorphus TaxID=672921 RepID=UPI003DA2AE4A
MNMFYGISVLVTLLVLCTDNVLPASLQNHHRQEKVVKRVRCRIHNGELLCDLISLKSPVPDILQRFKCLYLKDELNCNDIAIENIDFNKPDKSQTIKLERILNDVKLLLKLKDAEKQLSSSSSEPVDLEQTVSGADKTQTKRAGSGCWYAPGAGKYLCRGGK